MFIQLNMKISLVIILSLVAYCAAINDNCPAHLTKNEFLQQFGGSCYEFILDHPGNWHAASIDCSTRGGHLVDIHSYAEEAFLFNACQTLGFHNDKGLWIGLTDQTSENHWVWTSGKNFTFTNWASGQPGLVGGSEDCALMEFTDHGQWHDYPCNGFLFFSQNHGWICEYPIV